jgi:phospholipase/carboxylesterase
VIEVIDKLAGVHTMALNTMHTDILVQRPADQPGAPHEPAELLLLCHGVGSSAEDLRPLGQALAAKRPGAWVVSLRAPQPADMSPGWQWFSVRGVTEQNRAERVAAALPAFQVSIQAWQREAGATPAQTTVIGFSQGAIMALASTQAEGPTLAGRVIAIAGRLPQPAQRALPGVAIHLLHGEQDRVMPVALAIDALQQLQALGVPITLERFEGLGHGIDGRVLSAIVAHLAASSATVI